MKCSKLVGCTVLLLVTIAAGLQPIKASRPCPTGKQEWPELVGVAGCRAAAIIQRENRTVYTVVLPANAPPPPPHVVSVFHCDRVRVYIDHHGDVAKVPTIG